PSLSSFFPYLFLLFLNTYPSSFFLSPFPLYPKAPSVGHHLNRLHLIYFPFSIFHLGIFYFFIFFGLMVTNFCLCFCSTVHLRALFACKPISMPVDLFL
uniref:Uncharacterized protein n=1 Tax=Cucumis melo TaxID=3656 RepID=A0A9I9EDC3_CUCME